MDPIEQVIRIQRWAYTPRILPRRDRQLVYVLRSGRLISPPGGMSSGQIWLRSPHTCYVVVLGEQTSHYKTTVDLPDFPDFPIDVQYTWTVIEPFHLVVNQPLDTEALCRNVTDAHLEQLAEQASGRDGTTVTRRLPIEVTRRQDLGSGLELTHYRISRGWLSEPVNRNWS